MNSSPICLTTCPEHWAAPSRTSSEKRSTTRAAAASPMASVMGVKLDRSTKRKARTNSPGTSDGAVASSARCIIMSSAIARSHAFWWK